MYRFYRLFAKWKEYETNKMKDFTNIVKEFHSDLIQAVTEERYGVEMPLKSGKLMVISYRSRRNYPRFSAGYKDTNPSYHMNYATDGLKCKIIYSNHERRYRVRDRYMWSFEPETNFRKKVSQAFVKDHNRYIFSPDRIPGKFLKIEMENIDTMKIRVQKFLAGYDEFELT
jgi:hypothetical protein